MSDGLAPVCDQKLRGVNSRERCHAPDFLTLLCVTRSASRELQQHAVRMRKAQVGERAKKRKARPASWDGPSVENS